MKKTSVFLHGIFVTRSLVQFSSDDVSNQFFLSPLTLYFGPHPHPQPLTCSTQVLSCGWGLRFGAHSLGRFFSPRHSALRSQCRVESVLTGPRSWISGWSRNHISWALQGCPAPAHRETGLYFTCWWNNGAFRGVSNAFESVNSNGPIWWPLTPRTYKGHGWKEVYHYCVRNTVSSGGVDKEHTQIWALYRDEVGRSRSKKILFLSTSDSIRQ